MRIAEVLFFAADPLSVSPDGQTRRLLLDEEARQIREKVRAADYRDALHFDTRWATRTDDLLQALNERHPHVVHFSAHGGSQGLVLVGADGVRAHPVDADSLRQLFEVFRGEIRVVVLNACFSLPQARAIADAVGCAIGTPARIDDEAAIAFAASFYRAVAFGHSVQTAFDQARTALRLEHFHERESPRLVHREDVDPRRIVLIPARRARRAAVAATALLLTAGTAAAVARAVDGADDRRAETERSAPAIGGAAAADSAGDARPRGLATVPDPAGVSTSPGGSGAGGEDLAAALDLRDAGNHAAALPLLERAAGAGNVAAMAYLGIAYLNGEGMEAQPRLGVPWLRAAADAGDPRAMNALGVAYERGLGVNRSNRWAKHWYRQAAGKGYGEAMRNLAALHQRTSAPDSALFWYRKAVDAGSEEARVDLGWMYEEGVGVPRDTAAALRLYEAAGRAGLARGMVAAGQARERRGEYGQAREWYLRAVDAGSAEAMNNLGVLYQNGWGVRADRDEARRWYARAADAGSSVARANLAALGPR